MFNATWFNNTIEEWCNVYNITIEEAEEMAERERDYEDLSIETSCLGTTIFENEEWLYSPNDAVRIAKEEIAAEEEKENEKEAARKAELATFGDKTDKDNESVIKSAFNEFGVKGYAPRQACWLIQQTPGWSARQISGGIYEAKHNGRKYHIRIGRVDYQIERQQLVW